MGKADVARACLILVGPGGAEQRDIQDAEVQNDENRYASCRYASFSQAGPLSDPDRRVLEKMEPG